MKRIARPLLTVLFAMNVQALFACSPLLQAYPYECSLQDSYQAVTSSLKTDFGVDAEFTVANRALRLIEQDEYDKRKNEVNFMPWKIYEPAPSTWMLWEHGAYQVEQMAADPNFQGITIDIIEDLNKVLIDKKMMTTLAKLKGNSPGRIRTAINFLPPGTEFKCNENSISDADYRLLSNYDIKDYDGDPLIRPHFFKQCKNGEWGGQIWFMKSSKVKKELQRWVDNFNTNFKKYLNGDDMDQSPVEFITDAQRWFIGIHPFGDGNGRTSRFIQDLFMKKLGLPFIPTGRISMLATRDEYLRSTKKEVSKSVVYLEGCLAGYQKRKARPRTLIQGHCLPMYEALDTGERRNLVQERVDFGKALQDSIDEMKKKKN